MAIEVQNSPRITNFRSPHQNRPIDPISKEYQRVQAYNQKMKKFGNELPEKELRYLISEILLHPEYQNSNKHLSTPYSSIKFSKDGSIFIINNKKNHKKIAPDEGGEKKSRRLGWVYKKGEKTKEGETIVRSSRPTPCPTVQNEARFLNNYHNDAILPLYHHDIYQGKKNSIEKYQTITPYCDLGDLFDVLGNFDINFANKMKLTKFLPGGIEEIHNNGDIHFDLKCENILMRLDNEELLARISDFGLAIKEAEKDQLTAMRGSMDYAAPEILELLDLYSDGTFDEETVVQEFKKLISSKLDVYALGLILAAIWSIDPIATLMLGQEFSFSKVKFHPDTPPKVLELIKKMTEYFPDERISSKEANQLAKELN